MGVFASRSPFRPNPLGLSCVRLLEIRQGGPEGPVLLLGGADLVDGTPVYDIKPYIAYADSFPEARSGFAATAPEAMLKVLIPDGLDLTPEQRETLSGILALDPRPAYQQEPGRVYGMPFCGREVHFRVENDTLTVIDYA